MTKLFKWCTMYIDCGKEMCTVLDTYVKITKAKDGYELFGTGAVVKTVKE